MRYIVTSISVQRSLPGISVSYFRVRTVSVSNASFVLFSHRHEATALGMIIELALPLAFLVLPRTSMRRLWQMRETCLTALVPHLDEHTAVLPKYTWLLFTLSGAIEREFSIWARNNVKFDWTVY